MKARVNFDVGGVDAQRQALSVWLDEAEAGDMDGDEMVGRLAAIVAELQDQLTWLRRAVSW